MMDDLRRRAVDLIAEDSEPMLVGDHTEEQTFTKQWTRTTYEVTFVNGDTTEIAADEAIGTLGNTAIRFYTYENLRVVDGPTPDAEPRIGYEKHQNDIVNTKYVKHINVTDREQSMFEDAAQVHIMQFADGTEHYKIADDA